MAKEDPAFEEFYKEIDADAGEAKRPATEPAKEGEGDAKLVETPTEKKRKTMHRMRTEEKLYYIASCEKFQYEVKELLRIEAFLSSVLLLGCIFMLQFTVSVVAASSMLTLLSLFFLVLGTITLLVSLFMSVVANAFLARFLVLANQETRLGDKKYLVSLVAKGYAYKQGSKVLFTSTILSLVLFLLVGLLASHPFWATILFLAISGIGGAIFFYMQMIEKSSVNKTPRKPLPVIEEDISNSFPGSLPREREEKGDVDERLQLSSILAVLQSRVPKVRRDAIKALGKIGTPDAINTLVTALGDPVSEVRAQTVAVLGKSGEKSIREPLKCLLYDEAPEVRAAVSEALGNLGDEETLDLLIHALDDNAPEVRGTAAEALGNLGNKRALKYLVAKMKDKDWFVRHKTVIAVGKIKTELSTEAITHLIQSAGDENEYVVIAAKHVLKRLWHEMSQNDPFYGEIKKALEKVSDKELAAMESAKPAGESERPSSAGNPISPTKEHKREEDSQEKGPDHHD